MKGIQTDKQRKNEKRRVTESADITKETILSHPKALKNRNIILP
jgi:hypothetical protein